MFCSCLICVIMNEHTPEVVHYKMHSISSSGLLIRQDCIDPIAIDFFSHTMELIVQMTIV